MFKLPYRVWDQWAQRVMALSLLASVSWFVCRTIHWRLTGDASLMHYATFLMAHGRAPYRDIGDLNLPMSYAPTWMVDRFFGRSDLAWRIYDFTLLLAAGAAMYVIARPRGAFQAMWAGCLFALIHARDGLLQTGQRDLFAAVLLIGGLAFLLEAERGKRAWLALGFGVCAGAAATVKPSFVPFLLLAVVAYYERRETDRNAAARLWLALLGWLMALAGCIAWLATKGSLQAFWYALANVGPYHASIGHAPVKFLFSNSVSPIVWLLVPWLIVRLGSQLGARTGGGDPHPDGRECRLLLLAAGIGYISYLVQQRGYPYHRYPFQVFLLLVLGLDFMTAFSASGWRRWVGAAALLWGAVVLAPVSAVKAGRYEWQQQPFRAAVEADLRRIADESGAGSLDGKVQCLDSISGCVATLDDMRVLQSTGLLYDEFLFNPGGARVIEEERARFLADVEGAPPLVFVMSAPLFPAGPDEYAKLEQWPAFRDWLNAHYALEIERRFTVAVREAGRPEVPPGYRIYMLRR